MTAIEHMVRALTTARLKLPPVGVFYVRLPSGATRMYTPEPAALAMLNELRARRSSMTASELGLVANVVPLRVYACMRAGERHRLVERTTVNGQIGWRWCA